MTSGHVRYTTGLANEKHRLDRTFIEEWRMRRCGSGRGSYLVYLLADDDGVVAADLLRAELSVVERALVLVAVPVHGAEQPAASTLEPR